MEFADAMQATLSEYSNNITLKPKQIECLEHIWRTGGDLVANLPVGYGKSLIFHLLPNLLYHKYGKHLTVLVVSPLNVIQGDQLSRLEQASITSCRLDYKCQVLTTAASDQEVMKPELIAKVSISDVKKGTFAIVHCHPEALFNTHQGQELLNDEEFGQIVGAVVIDECHVVEEWGQTFRKAFKELDTLSAHFPSVPHVALSGTMTADLLKRIPAILGLKDPFVCQENPDRPNIFLQKQPKIRQRDFLSIYEDIFTQEIDKLQEDPQHYPVTLMYIPIEYMSKAVAFAYDKFGGDFNIHKSVFSCLFGKQDKEVSDVTLKELKKDNPRIRLVFSSSVTGMGFDSPSVTQVIHACPPRSLVQYMQEIGRAGRKDQPATAMLYYNNSDIQKNLPGIQQNIIDYCKCNNTCLRTQLLETFGFSKKEPGHIACHCCQVCKPTCTCDTCLKGTVEQLECDFSRELSVT